MNPEQYLEMVLAQIGLLGDERWDAQYTAILSRELEYIKSQTYDVKYPEYKAKMIIPVSYEIPTGASSWTYRQWEMFGAATVISNYASDLKFVDVMKQEFTKQIKSIGDAYQYSIQDLRGAAYSGVPIDKMRAQAARRAIENRFDIWGATGNATVGAYGLLNQPNVTLSTATTGSWVSGSATGAQVVVDINKLLGDILAANLDTFIPDTLALPPAEYRYMAFTPYNATYGEKSILRAFLDSNPYITRVEPWHRCTTAGASGVTRMVAYKRSPEVLTYEIPQEFEQFPPQPENLSFKVPCHARVAGVSSPYPLGIGFMDGI